MPPQTDTQASTQQGTSEHEALLTRITSRFESADKGVHKRARDKWDHFYALYRNYTDFRNQQATTDRRDRDLGLRYAQREWGAELFIPHSFAAVESILPRMLANSPKVIVKPCRQQYEAGAPAMKYVVDGQLAAIDYELRLQKIIRNALIYGLGVQKTYWNRRTREGKQLTPGTHSEWAVTSKQITLMDDPMIEAVDNYDFFWDPFGSEIQECEYAIHRTWRSSDYVRRMLDQGIWHGPTPQDVEMGQGGANAYTSSWEKRNRADGSPEAKAGDIHEVWEYHDGEKVVTVLDRQWIVQDAPNPAWHGELPFQVYRPTALEGHMVGIGEIEPIVDLQAEVNTLRSQRRDNATIALNRGFFFADGMIDPGDFKTGPGIGVPVLGDPREVVYPMPIADIPNSGYQEEASLLADIQRAIGLNDEAQASQDGTATGAQLVHAAMSLRIKLKTRNAEVELVRAAGRQVMAMNQQHILTNREVRIPSPPTPDEPDRRWAWRQIGPAELAGEYELDVEGGSLAPENIPQQRQDANMMMSLLQNPQVNPDEAIRYVLRNMGIDQPDSFIVQQPQEPTVPQAQVDASFKALQAAGVDPSLLHQAVANSTQPPGGKQ